MTKKLVSEVNHPSQDLYYFQGQDYKVTPNDGFSQEQLTQLLHKLLTRKQEILQKSKNLMKTGEIVLDRNEMADEVDLASISVEQNVTFKLLDRDRNLLGNIDRAIAKIASGDYGYCEGNGDVIPFKRLELTPWARFSVSYQEQREKLKKFKSKRGSF
ncbi:MAG: TraR/DksA family transcriptional regulator [Proteobacteria bacterium]|nr:TraR/DksA family transcriptional regulator [Pseudomonadota bacterium]